MTSCSMDGATICMVTHDNRYADLSQRTIQLLDCQVVDEAKMGETVTPINRISA